jgi:hypothetical protein
VYLCTYRSEASGRVYVVCGVRRVFAVISHYGSVRLVYVWHNDDHALYVSWGRERCSYDGVFAIPPRRGGAATGVHAYLPGRVLEETGGVGSPIDTCLHEHTSVIVVRLS